jgi:hypothetical protein
MAKFIFKKIKDETNRFDTVDVTFEIEADSMNDVIEAFEEFLVGSGFIIDRVKQSIDLVDNE